MFLSPMRLWTALVAALLVLDISLTFTNVWPPPAIHWRGKLSIERAVCIIALVVSSRRYRPPRTALAWISVAWIALVIGRYAQVTAPALYGRDVNLYWDLHLMPDVAAMVTRVAPWWLIVTSIAAVAFCFWLLYRGVRWALRVVVEASTRTAERRLLAALAALTVVLFAGERLIGRSADLERITPSPVTHTYARQVQLAAQALAAPHTLADSPPMDSGFEGVSGADVFLIFTESYGAVSFDRPAFASALAPSRARLDAAIRDTHRQVVSAFVESPTFGGGSWLAHLSLLSGVEVRDPDTNALLMTRNRDTLARSFGRRGFRTVALMQIGRASG